ncbi:MAG: chemotaxis protein methyltransferase CheR [Syntrophaceae bacterium]|nr:MAG: chemotaxis protein methyltransferase CheR [Syntrophaceae bacterium]
MTTSFHLEDKDYAFFRDLIQNRTGMLIGETRRTVLARALKEGVTQAKCTDIYSYLAQLMATDTDSELWDYLVKKLTIGESYFFRHLEQINALRRNILPDLIARHWTDRTLYLWSAGCATGEEPYTIAILLRELLPDVERWKIMILATDINRQALTRAAAGHYREWSLRDTDPQTREKYFSRKGDSFTLDPAVREMVTFAYLNLSEDKYPSTLNHTSHLDLILCRNVTIYLPPPVIQDIADRFHKCLSPGGWLMVAPSETNLEIYSKFQMLVFYGTVVYQRMERLPAATGLYANGHGQMEQKETPSVFALPQPSRKKHYPAPPQEHVTAATVSAVPTAVSVPDAPAVVWPKHETLVQKQEPNLYEQGDANVKERRYDDARKCFLAYLAKKPDSTLTRYRLACLEANAGHLDEARKWAEQALQNDPMDSKLHYAMGIIQQTQEKLEEALVWFKKTIYLDPDFILAHFSISHIYERTGKDEEAKRHRALAARLACQLSPDILLPGSDDLTADQLLGMVQTNKATSNTKAGRKA